MKIVIVGGGIMGLCAAWACVRAGHIVELVEQGPLPNPKASSFDHSRLIRYPYGAKTAYARMVGDAYRANDALFADLDARLYVETGTLIVVRGEDPWADATCTSLDELDVAYEKLEAATLAERYPLLNATGVAWALWTPTGGVLLARRMLDGLIAWLRRRPEATLRAGVRVDAVDVDGARVRTADGVRVAGDRVIVAAGPWTRDLFPGLGERARPSRQVALDLRTTPTQHAAWRSMPILLDGIAWRGSGFYAVPTVAGLDLKVGDHTFSLAGHPDHDREPTAKDQAQILALARAGLAAPDSYRVVEGRTCFYTVAPEERFLAEASGRGLLLASFSGHGFKFGPLVGQAARAWCEGRIATDALAHWLAGRAARAPYALDADDA